VLTNLEDKEEVGQIQEHFSAAAIASNCPKMINDRFPNGPSGWKMTSEFIILGLHQVVFFIEISEQKPPVFGRPLDFLPNLLLFLVTVDLTWKAGHVAVAEAGDL